MHLNVVWQIDNSNRRGTKPREFGWICHLLRDFSLEHIFDGSYEVIPRSPFLIVAEGFRATERIETYLQSIRSKGYPVGLIHIGDEARDTDLQFYQSADFVFRNYWRPIVNTLDQCHFLPLGPNCDVAHFDRSDNDISSRPHTWSFAGHIRPGPRKHLFDTVYSRRDGRLFATTYFNSGLPKDQYVDLLYDSQFVLCPSGYVYPESYRFYEALEAGCVPVVEDRASIDLVQQWGLKGANAAMQGSSLSYNLHLLKDMLSRESYWDCAYSGDFPCPRLYHWKQLPQILTRKDPIRLQDAIMDWWQSYKVSISKKLTHSLKQLFVSYPSYTPSQAEARLNS